MLLSDTASAQKRACKTVRKFNDEGINGEGSLVTGLSQDLHFGSILPDVVFKSTHRRPMFLDGVWGDGESSVLIVLDAVTKLKAPTR